MICLIRASMTLLLLALVLPARATWISPFISEIHYDNIGADVNELVGVTAPAGLNLSGWQLVLYNGANGQPYRSVSLSGQFGGSGGTWAESYWPVVGIQNGPDAVALLSPADRLIDFVAYEAVVVGSGGEAAGAVASLLPVSEGADTATTSSLQREGIAQSWIWSLSPATPGLVNPGLVGFDAVELPTESAWQLWLSGFCAWLVLWSKRRSRSRVAVF